jgi:hypothetical protein
MKRPKIGPIRGEDFGDFERQISKYLIDASGYLPIRNAYSDILMERTQTRCCNSIFFAII